MRKANLVRTIATLKIGCHCPVALLVCVLSLYMFMAPAWGQDAAAHKAADVRLIIDVSGSMKRNDPADLRQPAVDLLVRLLPEGSKAGVWTFGKYVNMLVPHQQVDAQWRSLAKAKAKEIDSVGLFTNIGEALEKAAYDAEQPNDDFATSLILLTDGMVDIHKDPDVNQREWRRIVDEVIPRLEDAGYTVHTVALSQNADRDLMEKLALSTGGLASQAATADELMKVFLQGFDLASPSQQVPLEGNQFAVDSSIEEFTALIFRQQEEAKTQLVSPDKQTFSYPSQDDDVRWHRTDSYDLVTVKRPLEGEWTVSAAMAPGSRVTVVSDLILKVKTLPVNAFRGASLPLHYLLQEGGETITNPNFLALLGHRAELSYKVNEDQSDNTVWQHDQSAGALPEDGIFRVTLPDFDRLGQYQLTLTVDGKTFERQFRHNITVRQPFTAAIETVTDENGQQQTVLTVRAHGEKIIASQTQIAATLIKPNRRQLVKPLGTTEFDTWQTLLHFDQPGQYRVEVRVTGEDVQGNPFEYALEPLVIDHNPDADFTETPRPPEPEPESAPAEQADATAPANEEQAPAEPDEPTPGDESPPEQSEGGFPAWLLWSLLALANVLIIGGGFFLVRKWMSDSENDNDEAELEQPPTQAQTAAPVAEETGLDDLPMDDGGDEDDEPPMEDLDMGEPDDLPMDEMDDEYAQADTNDSDEAANWEEPDLEEAGSTEEDDYGVDDIEDDLLDQLASDEEGDEADTDNLADEMLKAQGLDLAENELDDAISNLIGELDGQRPKKQGDEPDESDD